MNPSVSQPALANFTGVQSIAGYYTPSDNNRHVIVGLKSGETREIFYNPKTGVGNDQLWQATAPIPAVTDISPDASSVKFISGTNASGLTPQLAGDPSTMYAVTLNGGIAKSVNGGPWTRLPNSPRYVWTLAVDPNNRSHLVAGERGGDAVGIPNGGGAGVWESLDAGITWNRISSPTTASGCALQAIPAVAFTPASSIVIASACGVGWRKAGSTEPFSFAANTSGGGIITALAVSPAKLWARSGQQLYVSTTDGQTWTAKSIPPQFTPMNLGDQNSLAAFDTGAYMSCCNVVKAGCDSLGKAGNWDQLLIYDAATDQFALQAQVNPDSSVPPIGCSGTGLGGRRFVKAFKTMAANGTVTNHIFYGTAQEVYEAVNFNSASQATQLNRILGTDECTLCTTPDQVHGDLWDFLISADGAKEWVSCDGGIYSRSFSNSSWSAWTLEDNSLHTHHIHTITAMRSSPTGRGNLAYATSDNSSWWWNGAKGWGSDALQGDINYTLGDAGNASIAIMVLHPDSAELSGLGENLSSGEPAKPITILNDRTYDTPAGVSVIQSLWGEARKPGTLDVLMLVNLPMQWEDSQKNFHPLPNAFGASTPVGAQNPLILRNQDFASNPDINISKGTGWTVAQNNLPAGVQKFWVTGGHTNTTYFVYAVQSGIGHVYKTTGSPASSSLSSWTELNVQGSILEPKPWPTGGIEGASATYGPLFVNPYDASQVYVWTSSGVQFSNTGGLSFQTDTVLTNLITGNGKYPLDGLFSGGDSTGIPMASRAVALGALADMDFRRDDPRLAVAASPYTGVFFRDKNGNWHDLTSLLPKPQSSVSSVRIDCDAIYIGTEGGGIYRVTGYEGAL